MLSVVVFALSMAVLAAAAPAATATQKLGIRFEDSEGELPILSLPYATYKATSYEVADDIYYFSNIRFAAAPTGDLRFAKPAPPQETPGIQNGSYGPSCAQDIPFSLFNAGGLSKSPIGTMLNALEEGLAGEISEDCLFLDIQVPGKAIRNPDEQALPVVVWIFGGAFTFGSKNVFGGLKGGMPFLPLYEGTGVLRQSHGDIIFVSINYRLGALGWLAGNTMERSGTSNLGLWDQRAALQWVQDYIYLLGGDKTQVSAWGESAGASAIFHHLVAFGGSQDPLFSKAVVMSPAFEILFDRQGQLEDTFQSFATAAGCPGGDMGCLRRVNFATIQKANSAVISSAVTGSSDLGPAADGSLIRQLAGLEFLSGNYWKNLDSLIVSHVCDEADIFVSDTIIDNKQVEEWIHSLLPAYASPAVEKAVLEEYPAAGTPGSPYMTARERDKAFVRDSTFTCNVRTLTQAYAGKTYNMQYSVTPGLHSDDVLAMFFDSSVPLGNYNASVDFTLIPGFATLAEGYQSYMASHAIYGDPNTARLALSIPPTITWPHPSQSGDAYANVLNVGDLGFSLIVDTQISANSNSHCDFITQFNRALTNLNGYAAPGTFMQSTIGRIVTAAQASANYTTHS
ncbi:Carboxylesterase family-domain-containing protein [Paecilomyces variotii]|uniref:Carboxylesterase family-domain-containing protein n=1 Tax=Byssochlamys spectabilis TaxID=264951 RepID=A0A443HUH4_BYSSP|nr:Carboxylesterase family-domain-containing protein [Paecilomyces variotii]KAJ9364797.1 hypothetical protein DTO280E4_1092 [Paecilomyces variotii]KAJ9369604.1 hypothetical protein DTO282E5_5733 [Paecilomyces variotii]RWQ95463.1 Carboxylesterase family-domain-containing protein [Paecilomyces variotii]